MTESDTTRRYNLLAERHQLCEEARDWYSQAIKDDQPTFIAWVRQFVPQPLRAAVLGIHHGIAPETTIPAVVF